MCLGIPGRIVEISSPEMMLGVVEIAGVRRRVNLACVVDEDHPIDACLGDWVLVHVGFAMARIDEDEAAETLALLEQLGQMQDERDAMAASGEA
ncbi:MAG: HypC/HybG/HupF family hydrogenase formation chaperone [Rhodospirillaceae bacterium]|nr:HypC/HybG/HupF family hydrogenase formation chaperone [Rhodospirillaceae bacterium]